MQSGFADVHDGFLKLTDSEIRDSRNIAPVTPIQTDWQNLTASRNVFDLVSIEAEVVAQVRLRPARMNTYCAARTTFSQPYTGIRPRAPRIRRRFRR